MDANPPHLYERLFGFLLFTWLFRLTRFFMLLYFFSVEALSDDAALHLGPLCRCLILTDTLLILGSYNWRSMMLVYVSFSLVAIFCLGFVSVSPSCATFLTLLVFGASNVGVVALVGRYAASFVALVFDILSILTVALDGTDCTDRLNILSKMERSLSMHTCFRRLLTDPDSITYFRSRLYSFSVRSAILASRSLCITELCLIRLVAAGTLC